jgi:subtilisin-like proprotein convertase family protein
VLNKDYYFNLLLSFIGCCFFLFGQQAQGQDSWKVIGNSKLSQYPVPLVNEQYYELVHSQDVIKPFSSKSSSNDQITLPNEKGEEEVFLLKPAPVMSSVLSIKYSNIRTYKGYSLTRPEVKVRLSSHSSGINAWITLPNSGDYFIQPVKSRKGIHFAYQKTKNDTPQEFFCKTVENKIRNKITIDRPRTAKQNAELRVFRIAIAATGEYTEFWGDDDPLNGSNAEDAFGSVVSTINRVNQVFEDELNVRLELVSDASLLFEDSTTDPFTGNFSSELQSTVDELIGDANYDIGHLFDFGEPNGDAGCIGCVCESEAKAQGYSTHPFTDIFGGEYRNDYFDLDYVGHEIGHQFGAYHTFSYNAEGTGVNAEPGSGSTIMGYAGITIVDDVQLHGDPYFHYYSIQNIKEFVASLSCGESEIYPTEPFSVDAGPDYFIPMGTPYELAISPLEGSDIYYCWEQLDSGQITSDNFGPYNVTGSMARSLPPQTNAFRTIPNLQRILSNNLTEENPEVGDSWETVSLVERDLEWGLTVRKNFGEYSQLSQDNMKITVVASSSPFAVSSQASSSLVWEGGSQQTIVWDVADTNLAPINLTEVEITLSIDGGRNFNIILADNVPNTGEAIIYIPNSIETDEARIKVKAKEGIFFAINREDFKISSRQFALNFNNYELENCNSNRIQFDFDIERKAGFDASFSIQADALPNGVEVISSKAIFGANDDSGSLVFTGLNELPVGDYDFNIEAIYGTEREVFSVGLKQRESNLAVPLLNSPSDAAENQSLNTTLSWENDPNSDAFRVQIASDETFQSLVVDTLLSQNQLAALKLNSNQQFYWRVQQQNSCGTSLFSDPFSFATTRVSCVDVSSSGVPKNLADASEFTKGITTASIKVNYDLPIQDIDVLVDIEHTWLEDLTLYLKAPDETIYLLTNELGDSADDYSDTVFDQEATTSIKDGTAPYTGRFRPIQSLAPLYGTSSFGSWSLIVEDNYVEDTGRLVGFELSICLEGTPMPNSDNDSIVDENDNCPEITNEDQSDVDNNGIGDVCDIFSAKNISIIKKDVTCPNQTNGSIDFKALADFIYRAEILGNNGYQKNLTFTKLGNGISNLAEGIYSICVYSPSFEEFEFCFETKIEAPQPLEVITSLNAQNSILNLSLTGSDRYWIDLNGTSIEVQNKQELAMPLERKLNRIQVSTSKNCQGVFEQWINTSETASVFPNPIVENATLILPENTGVDLRLLSGSGSPLWEKKNIRANNVSVQIPMSRLAPGFYLLRVIYPNKVESIKLLKR